MSEYPQPAYLGDGVYATFDGYHIWLDLRAQPGGARIALEPQVVENLQAYIRLIENARRDGKETNQE